jgi:secreted PhoX family phosphatase
VNATGEIAQIPGFGLAAWETFNNIATGTKTTAVFGNEDGSATNSQLWLYQGTKTTSGTWYQRAGLTNGKTYVMKIGGFALEKDFRAFVGKGIPTAVTFQEINATNNGVGQNLEADIIGTSLARVEDGAFDPRDPSTYYFLTTESNKDAKATSLNPDNKLVTKRDGGALWKLKLKDRKNPAAGGTITMLLDGSEAPYLNKPDNLEVDGFGNILIQEDPGNNAQLSRMIAYRISDGKMTTIAQFNSEMFSTATASAKFITEDEETSGVLNVTSLFRTSKTDTNKYYIFVAQVHATGDALLKARPDIVTAEGKSALLKAIEAGQIYLMTVSDWSKVYN